MADPIPGRILELERERSFHERRIADARRILVQIEEELSRLRSQAPSPAEPKR